MDTVTEATFEDEVLRSAVPVLVDFWAPWCRPCAAIEPHLRSLAEEHAARLRLVRVNVDESLALSGRYGVLALPTVILFAGGEERARVVGVQPRSRYERALAPHL
ncbi:MAG TPA: thioredoxin domain-containing protein [Gaiellaceae bacterium]|nr:thioredoxin domain-containing protein [Gaiellaceae bacterium]